MTTREYLDSIEAKLRAGNATEHTYRADLAAFINGLAPGITATNEPKRSDFGAIDYVVTRTGPGGRAPVGYIEAKDVGVDLVRTEKAEQLGRYRRSLHNLILTDYLEFRWYLGGDLRATARLGAPDSNGKIRRDREGEAAVKVLLEGFLAQTPPKLGNPRELAERMAELTHTLRDQVLADLRNQRIEGGLHLQMEAFRRTLLPGLEPEEFADMYAQTIAYGLFAARAASPDEAAFTRYMAPHLLPRTNPFLRRFFGEIGGLELPESVSWIVEALAGLLANADMEAVLRDFGRRTRQEDPVVHFYETFLAKYDPKMREMRGVYYTPEPVVSYIVRSVDQLIKSQLVRQRGLADPETIILDPALGTGTFLYAVMSEIHESFRRAGNLGAWNGYVSEKLLGRIFGFELLMAPYAVAHLKLGLLLAETGYNPASADERLGIYLTNTLAEGVDAPPIPFAGYISDEANAATGVKRDKPIMVVLGNPPYSGHSANKGEWIRALVDEYTRRFAELRKPAQAKWLQDDYVKFIRFGQWRIDQTGQGVLAFISNHSYLDNPTFRGMRQSLMDTFSSIYILDLHGNSKKRERPPDGGPDDNVFDIQQGVAIGLFIKEPGQAGPAKVYHAELWGRREDKYRILCESDLTTTEWSNLSPQSPFYFFKPQDTDLLAEFERGWKVSDVMGVNGDPAPGMVTTHDQFAISWSAEEANHKVLRFLRTHSEEEARDIWRLCSQAQWNYHRAKAALATGAWMDQVRPVLYRPFDLRWTVFDSNVAVHRRERVMQHMLAKKNLALSTTRSVEIGRGFEHVLCTEHIIGHHTVSLKEVNYLFPLYLYPEPGQMYQRSDAIEAARKAIRGREGLGAREQAQQLDEVAELVRRLYPGEEYPRWPNLSPRFIADVESRTGLRFAPDSGIAETARNPSPAPSGPTGDGSDVFTPEDVFHYIYAVLHSPAYRSRYAPFLKSDFPRVPITSDRALFRDLAVLGARLVDLHLMRPAAETLQAKTLQATSLPGFPQAGSNLVEAVRYDSEGRRVFINKTQHFTNVPPEVWEFHIGGYQVCEKWLKDRKGRTLTYDDIEHYRGIVTALGHTVQLMAEIDARIPGWPIE